jgi:DNA-binding SARP family transcriptional activator
MEFRLLGPVVALAGDDRVDLGRRRERCLLGLLLLEAGRSMPAERLLTLLWEADPPPTALRQLRVNVSRLRARLALRGVRILTSGRGYVVDVDPSSVDAHVFGTEVRRAMAMSPGPGRAAALDSALGRWRGPLMADVASDWLRERIGVGLEELRMSAVELRAETELDLRSDTAKADMVADLAVLVERYPLRERLVGTFMLALYREGRRSEALRTYLRVRARLVDELGVGTSRELERLYGAILRGDEGVYWGADRGSRRVTGWV